MIDWFGPVITEHYGSTELGAVAFCTAQEWLDHPGTVGRALPGCEIEIHDADGNPLPPGESGEIVSRRVCYPDFTYHGDDAKRRSTGRAGGLLAPGDMGRLDEDGFLYLSGRASDMIIFGGTNVYPAEIEAEIHKIPGVADCAVFGIPDEAYGEVVCAHVQPDPGATLTEAGAEGRPQGHAGLLQDPPPRGLRDQPAARGHRQDLQAQDPRPLLGGAGPRHLSRRAGSPTRAAGRLAARDAS